MMITTKEFLTIHYKTLFRDLYLTGVFKPNEIKINTSYNENVLKSNDFTHIFYFTDFEIQYNLTEDEYLIYHN